MSEPPRPDHAPPPPVPQAPEPPQPPQPSPLPPRDATLREVFTAVFWSFFGVRKGRHMRRDAVTIRPHQVVIVGVAAGAIFVLTLVAIVRLILRVAGA